MANVRINAQVYGLDEKAKGKVILVRIPLNDCRITKTGKPFFQLTGEYEATDAAKK